jgi:hypothetical protein
LDNKPVIRQLKSSLLSYVDSDAFKPDIEVSIKDLKTLFRQPGTLKQLNAKVISVDSSEIGHEGVKAIDSDPTTIWHTQWSQQQPSHPHEIQIELNDPVKIKGITYLSRQDGNKNGWVNE